MDYQNYYNSLQSSQISSELTNQAKQVKDQKETEKFARRKEIGDLTSGALTAVGTEELTSLAKKSAKAVGKRFLSKVGVNDQDADDVVNGRAIPLVRRNVNRLLRDTDDDTPPPPRPPAEIPTREVTRVYSYEDVVNDKDLFTNHIENDPALKQLADDNSTNPAERANFIEEARQDLLENRANIPDQNLILTTREPIANAEGLQPGYRVLADVDGRIPNANIARNIYGQPLDMGRQATAAEADVDDAARAAQGVGDDAAQAAGRVAEREGGRVARTVARVATEGGEETAEIPDIGEVVAPLLLLTGGIASLFHKKHNTDETEPMANPSSQFLGN
jgi:hypothetical protein